MLTHGSHDCPDAFKKGFPLELIKNSLLNSPFERGLGGEGIRKHNVKYYWFFKVFLVRPSVPGGWAGSIRPSRVVKKQMFEARNRFERLKVFKGL